MKRTFIVLGLVLGGALAVADHHEEGFKSLFNGRDLTGWEGNPDLWSVREGVITGVTKAEPRLTHNTFLVYTGDMPGDFELRLSYRIVNGNSGIQYRSKVFEKGAFGPIVGVTVGTITMPGTSGDGQRLFSARPADASV